MNSSEILVTLAEVSAAFVGFTMVVGALRPTSSAAKARILVIQNVAVIGVAIVGGAFAPPISALFPISETLRWQLCSAGMSLLWCFLTAMTIARYRKAGVVLVRTGPGPLTFHIIVSVFYHSLLWWNVFVPTGSPDGRYLAALLALLIEAGTMFIFATVREELPMPEPIDDPDVVEELI